MTGSFLEIDGSHGEGGGQILRTALALSCLTGRPFRLSNIRRGRPRPGLQPQHLAAVRAAAQICGAEVVGEARGSTELRFLPGGLRGGALAQEIGTAGSVSLVLQTVLPPLLFADQESRLRLGGGTHVPFSPPWSYLEEVFLPALAPLGASVALSISRHGFYPAGGGTVEAEVRPAAGLRSLTLCEPGALLGVAGVSAVGKLPLSIAERQRDAAAAILRERFGAALPLQIATSTVSAAGPGTYLMVHGVWERVRAGYCALGAPGKRAEAVGEEAAHALLEHAATAAPVDPHLADQLVPYLAVADGPSEFVTSRVTRHLLTNLWTAERFLGLRWEVTGEEGRPGQVRIEGAGCAAAGGRPQDRKGP